MTIVNRTIKAIIIAIRNNNCVSADFTEPESAVNTNAKGGRAAKCERSIYTVRHGTQTSILPLILAMKLYASVKGRRCSERLPNSVDCR